MAPITHKKQLRSRSRSTSHATSHTQNQTTAKQPNPRHTRHPTSKPAHNPSHYVDIPCGVTVSLRQHQTLLIQRLLDTSSIHHHLPHRLLFVAPTGSGKTIAGIVAGVCMVRRGLADGVHVVAPKSVVPQFQAEVSRLVPLDVLERFEVITHTKYFSSNNSLNPKNKLLIVDEAHVLVTPVTGMKTVPTGGRPRDTIVCGKDDTDHQALSEVKRTFKTGSRAYYAISAARKAKGLLLMTATPLQNSPLDLLNLLCMVCGYTHKEFYNHPRVNPVQKLLNKAQKNFLLSGNKGVLKTQLADPLVQLFVHWTAPKIVFANRSSDGLPDVQDRIIHLPMDETYLKLYNAVECNQLTELKKQLQKSAQDNKSLSSDTKQSCRRKTASRSGSDTCDVRNPGIVSPLRCVFQPDAVDAFYLKLRQVVNGVTRNVVSAKVTYAVKVASEGHIHKRRVVIYSNFIDGGLSLVSHKLKGTDNPCGSRIPFVQIIGQCSQTERKKAVQNLNAGHVHVLLLSKAGCEGLDLKGVRDVVLLEPHFHNERLQQVVGRAVRYRSHDNLPPNERNVIVHRLMLQKPSDNEATWREMERRNETEVRRLIHTYRLRARHNSVQLHMNVANKCLYENLRRDIWHEELALARTGNVRTLRDPYDRVVVNTSTVEPTDFCIYVQFTDSVSMVNDNDETGPSEDGYMYDELEDGWFDGDDTHPTTPENSTVLSPDTSNGLVYDDKFTLHNVHRDISVDDVVNNMAQRKSDMNKQFLRMFKKRSSK